MLGKSSQENKILTKRSTVELNTSSNVNTTSIGPLGAQNNQAVLETQTSEEKEKSRTQQRGHAATLDFCRYLNAEKY